MRSIRLSAKSPFPVPNERTAFHETSGFRGFAPIVLGDVANEDVGVETDHRPAPRRLIAAFIASIETGRRGL